MSEEVTTFELQSEEAPFTSTYEVLRYHGTLFLALCMRYLRANPSKILNDYGGYNPKSASFQEMRMCLNATCNESICNEWFNECNMPTLEQCDLMIGTMQAFIPKCTELTFEMSPDLEHSPLTIELLRQHFSLSDFELNVIIGSALIQFDEGYGNAWRYVTGSDLGELPKADFFMHLYGFMASDEAEMRAVFEPDHPLLRYGLIEVKKSQDWGANTPLNLLSVCLPKRVLAFILGTNPSFVPVACRWMKPVDDDQITLDKATDRMVQKNLQKSASRLALIGYRGIGRSSAFVYAAQRMDMSVLRLDLADFVDQTRDSEDTVRSSLAIILREIRIKRALLLIDFETVQESHIEWLRSHAGFLNEMICQEVHLRYAVLLPRQTELSRLLFGELSEVVFPPPGRDVQPKLWFKALSLYLPKDQAKEVAELMATGYCLSYTEIRAAIEQTLARLNTKPALRALTAENISESLNKTRGHKLEGMATLRSTTLLLKDIVLSDDIRTTLNEILNYARHSETVMQDWGFSKYNSSGAGLSVLLSGVPGTGKTLTALVLAHELGRALYVVDLSRVVDKYIGETEKKLSVIFDEAERSQAMLLFDEADSLFAKRTDVKSSNDRYANLEVNYLLQRLEAYRGVSILTTNFGGGLDEALARRIQFKVNFPMPDPTQRAELWNRLIPPGAPRSKDIDLVAIAREFEMSGGHIKNAIFRASIQAVSENRPLNHAMLWDAAVREYRSMGHIVRD